MKNIKKIYSQIYDSITNDETIYKNTLEKIYKKNKRVKKIYLGVFSMFIVFLTFFGIVYAQEIGDFVKSIFDVKDTYTDKEGKNHDVYHLLSNGGIEINDDLKLEQKECKNTRGLRGPLRDTENCDFYSDTEIEKMFNIKLIKSDLDTKKEYYLNNLNKTNDGKILSVFFQKGDMYSDYDTENVNVALVRVWIGIHSIDNDSDLITTISEETWNNYKKINITSLDVDGYVVSGNKSRILYIVYDKVVYKFGIYSRGRNVNDLDEEVDKLVKSFKV